MRKILTYLVSIVAVFFIVQLMQPKQITFDVEKYQYEELVMELESPNGDYKVNVYKIAETKESEQYDVYARLYTEKGVEDGGVTVWLAENSKIIYYEENAGDVDAFWVENTSLAINGREIQVPNGQYDSR